ncbi:ABC transporter ATP-binding protein [Hornefia butyriciproducens]|uniref:betaine/proline/choline family ABC transporter ATP-binding protein n=1 Tax=Hornefia butyriciproducens TaxID=2652293 RepID=UPI002A914B95|nr:ABC transporter ATP-binding protein [Hornefia butyriciproducens]MCI7413138.1 ABC transporter ATP-binding protein [Clostridiales bacterium]MDY6211266.1 ABC transporter ATP-binding protein [Hornefia butyriciproducens]
MIQLIEVTKAFKNNVVLDRISMDFHDGELTVLIGPSGCGKTTTLKMINRLLPASSGKIIIDGKNIESIDKVKLRRNMGYVIQQGGLFPHMTVRQNIEIIEKLEGKDEYQILKKTERLMEMVDMDPGEFLERYPTELSGGQQQRIGVIRALANDPEYVLLDEPFSALDPLTRSSLQDELTELHRKMGKTMIFVTHDMDEAIKIADRICIMKDGHILQYDTPEEILRRPANDFVANFVGLNRIWDSPEYIRVEDFMIREPVTCDAELTAKRCITKLTMHHVDTLLVTGNENRLMGIINRKSLYSNRQPERPARDIMLPVKYTAHPEDSILDVLKMIDQTDVSNVPVVDDLGRLVGLLTNSNLVSTLSRQYLEEPTEEVLEND